MGYRFCPQSGIVCWLLLASSMSAALPAERDERREAVTDSGPLPPVKHEAVREPSGVIAITGEAVRSWRDCLGNQTEGRLVGLHGATVFLAVEEETLTVALAWLSTSDRQYVRSVLRAGGKANLFPGEADGKDESAALRLTASQWQRQLNQWVKVLNAGPAGDSKAAEEAWNHLRNVRDPKAIAPLATLAARENNTTVRTACVEAIAAIGGADATRLLVKLAATDRSTPVRASATWALCHLDDPATALAEFAQYLRVERFREPALVSLHATGLVRPLNSDEVPNAPLVDALIDTLIVKERRYVPYVVWWGYDTGWTPRGRHVHFQASRRLARFQVPVPCEMGRRMLVEYTGQDYGYDRQAWRGWQAKRFKASP
ncbi:MAG: HEAT repeat domain-containing protein [Thermoguttaceae bacterium]|nr:HEAT repeat domain-containing protein [Thermoguttaceae bacterium]